MLKTLTPGIRDLLPSLMGGALSVGDEEYPASEVLRPVWAQNDGTSTFVIPATFPEQPRRWFPDEATTYPTRDDAEVEFYVDGEATFEAMVEAIETATGPDHFIILLGWAAYFDFQLSKSGTRTASALRTAGDVLEERAKAGVQIRVLLWKNVLDRTANGDLSCIGPKIRADSWNSFAPNEMPRRSVTIIDDGTRERGAHHQKILLVQGEQGLVAFVGGLDFNSDRVNNEPIRLGVGPPLLDTSGPLHDVHLRVRGMAAEDVLVLAVNRWNFAHPADVVTLPAPGDRDDHVYRDPGLPPGVERLPEWGIAVDDLSRLLEVARGARKQAPEPRQMVRVAQTVGNPRLKRFQYVNGVRPMIEHAIRQSRKFIYVEDQYFWSEQAIRALAEVLPVVRCVVVLTPPDSLLHSLKQPRHRALKYLKEKAGKDLHKVHIHERTGVEHRYIHSKTSIYDDEFAITGSANWNDRGFYHDSEVIAGVCDLAWDRLSGTRYGRWHILELDAAHKLRLQLWSEHLGLAPDQLIDGVAASLYWMAPPPAAQVRVHEVDGEPWYRSRTIDEVDYKDGGWKDAILDPYF